MKVVEVNKESGAKRLIALDEAVVRLKNYYGCDVKALLLKAGLMQTSFFYYELKGEK